MDGVVFDVGTRADRADYFQLLSVFVRPIEPAQHGTLAGSWHASEPVQQYVVKLQSLRAMHGHDLQSRIDITRYTLEIQLRLELGNVGQRARHLEIFQHIEIAVDIADSVPLVEQRGPAKGQPGFLDTITQGSRAPHIEHRLEDRTHRCQPLLRIA